MSASTTHQHSPGELVGDGAVDARLAAADLLRQVRQCPWHEIETPLRWAVSYLPHSRPVLRLKIHWLIEQDDLDAAESLLARALKKFDEDGGLRALAAQCQLMRGHLQRAETEIRRALQLRPNHRRTAFIASEIAAAQGRLDEAINMARGILPEQDADCDSDVAAAAHCRLVEWLIEANRLDEAEATMRRIARPMPIAQARVIQARGRLCDADQVVCEALQLTDDDANDASRDQLLALHIEILEEMSHKDAVVATLGEIETHTPLAAVRVGLALLTFGEFARAAALFHRLLPQLTRHRRRAQHVLMVAAAVAGDVDQAESLLDDLEAVQAVDTDFAAECWRRAMIGELMREPCAAGRDGAFVHTGQLRPLLIDALAVLQGTMHNGNVPAATDGSDPAASRRPTVPNCIETCQQLLNGTLAQ